MINIRRQSIKGAIWVYVGFAIGAFITYLFTNKNWFTTEQYGLTRSIGEIGMLVFAFSSMGTGFYLFKFFPYYHDNLDNKDNDLLGQALKIALCGFAITIGCIYLLEPIIIRKFGTNAALLVEYFYMIIPVGFLYLMFNLLECYSYGFHKGVTTNFLKETAIRIYTLTIILLKIFSLINFKTFIILFGLQYFLVTVVLGYILYKEGNLWLHFKTSRVTKKFRKNIFSILSLTVLTLVVNTIRGSIDSLMLSAKLSNGLGKVAIFGFVTYLTMIMQAPIRSLGAITIPVLSRHWKEKKMDEIDRIYQRSSINLLAFTLFIFFLILLNFVPAIHLFDINSEYLDGKNVFIIMGLVMIIELGTGLNAQIIGTSSFFRFELWTSILITLIIIPSSYFLTIRYGLLGPALANLISIIVYNIIRFLFLYKKFGMQPFTTKTVEIIFIAVMSFLICDYVFAAKQGLIFIILRSIVFCVLFIVPTYLRNISPDLKPVLETMKKRIGI